MFIENFIKEKAIAAVKELYNTDLSPNKIIINETRKEFDGEFTLVVFPFVKIARKKPEDIGKEIGAYLIDVMPMLAGFNTIKGFLNLQLKDSYWLDVFQEIDSNNNYGQLTSTGKKVVLEYIGPNTNKPLHLGHLRNMFLGYAMANILSQYGHEVHKVTIYNDRGITICKSMAAWQQTANGATPESTNTKGDHFVGQYYVAYNKMADEQMLPYLAQGMNKRQAEKQTAIYKTAQNLLLRWEAGDEDTIALWKMMNDWVYEGFFETYNNLGVDYEKAYHESDFYKLGKDLVLEGLEKEVFTKKADNSIVCDLTEQKLDEKLLLRSDGTSIYITQDLGVAEMRYKDYQMDDSIYVVGNEQDYHFTVLKLLLQKLEKPYADGISHLSYGMVDLPDGKMKSREGKVVDADELYQEMLNTAKQHTEELGKTEGMGEIAKQKLYKTIAIGALKYFILRVQAIKRMMFNPKESIDFIGNTGPFIQYTYARSQSIKRKTEDNIDKQPFAVSSLAPIEKQLLQLIYNYPAAIKEAAESYDPSVIANYAYNLAKTFNKMWAELSILNNEDENLNIFRSKLSLLTGRIIKSAMATLGIDVPARM